MKKIISLIIAAVCLSLCLSSCDFDFSGCSLNYDYDNGKTVDNVYYVFNSKNKTCFAAEYQWDGKSTHIVIQDEVDGYKVTQLGGYCGRGVPTPFGIDCEKSIVNETSSGSANLLWESELPETAVVHYINFDIKIGKYVDCIEETTFEYFYCIDENNYIKPLVTFSVSPDNNDFLVDDSGMIYYVKEGDPDVFDYAATHTLESCDKSKYYKLLQNDDQSVFRHYIFDAEGDLIDSGSSEALPSFWSVGDCIMQLSVQDGTGPASNHARYYDLKNSKKSKTFDYVLAANDEYVVCADNRNSEHIIIVQDIFDKEKYYKEYELEDVSSTAADFAIDGYFDEEGNINITYYSGENCEEIDHTIVLSTQ